MNGVSGTRHYDRFHSYGYWNSYCALAEALLPGGGRTESGYAAGGKPLLKKVNEKGE